MPDWANSDRRKRLPPNWDAIRIDVFERDGHRCTTIMDNGQRCPNREDLECDHVLRGDDHRRSNLTTRCNYHHKIKSSQEGAEALAKKRAKINQSFRRQTEPHPGSLGG